MVAQGDAPLPIPQTDVLAARSSYAYADGVRKQGPAYDFVIAVRRPGVPAYVRNIPARPLWAGAGGRREMSLFFFFFLGIVED